MVTDDELLELLTLLLDELVESELAPDTDPTHRRRIAHLIRRTESAVARRDGESLATYIRRRHRVAYDLALGRGRDWRPRGPRPPAVAESTAVPAGR